AGEPAAQSTRHQPTYGCYAVRALSGCRHLDADIVVAGALAEVRAPVRRHEGADRLAGRTGCDPGTLFRRHDPWRYGISDDQRQDHLAQFVVEAHALAASEIASGGVLRMHEERRCFTGRTAHTQQRR